MSGPRLQRFRSFLTEQLTSVAVGILSEVESIVEECYEENKRLRNVLHMVLSPEINLSRIDAAEHSGAPDVREQLPAPTTKVEPEISEPLAKKPKEEPIECTIGLGSEHQQGQEDGDNFIKPVSVKNEPVEEKDTSMPVITNIFQTKVVECHSKSSASVSADEGNSEHVEFFSSEEEVAPDCPQLLKTKESKNENQEVEKYCHTSKKNVTLRRCNPLEALFGRITFNDYLQNKVAQRTGPMAGQPEFVRGRKRRHDIWAHFNYSEKEKKTECMVEKDGGKCGYKITGKNTTNLKRHLKTFHNEIEIPERASMMQVLPKRMDKPTSAQDFFATRRCNDNSPEQHTKEEAIAQWIGRTGLPARIVEDEEFINMMAEMDKMFKVPKRHKILNLIEKMYKEEKEKIKQNLATARRITTGLHIWTKKGLTASFVGVSACYFNPDDNKAEHKLLNLREMVHPHTAASISTLMDESMEEWGIPRDKVLTTITDNGSNMVASIYTRAEVDTTSEEDSEAEHDDDEHQEGEDDRYDYGAIERTPCVIHTIQLVVSIFQREPPIRKLLEKVRHLVNKFRKSSVATERLLQKRALVLVKDCPTRWSSCFAMLSRCLEVKEHLTAVAESMGWDGLQPSEWQKIGMLRDLLLPFAEHTKSLESDTQSLSLVVPVLLDLKNHLSEFSLAHGRTYKDAATLAQKMLSSMDKHFSVFLDITADNFSPLPAAACFVDPCVAETFLANDDSEVQNLVRKAEDYIAHLVPQRVQVREEQLTDDEQVANENTEAPESTPAKWRRFKFFSANHPLRPKTAKTTNIRQEILKYKEGLSESHQTPATSAEVEESGIEYWLTQCCSTMFPTLKPLALDLLAMPASQAFTERVFSVTGYLSCGHSNRARATLERSAFLKVNKPK